MFIGTIGGGLLGQLNLAIPFLARAGLLGGVFVVASILMTEIGFEPKPLDMQQIPAQMRRQAQVGIAHGWGHPGLRLLMISAGLRGIFFGWAFYAAQPYFLELLDRDAVWIVGLVTAGVSLATILGNQIVEALSHRCGKRSTMLIGAATVSTISAVSIGLTSSFAVAVAGLMLVAAAMGVMMPVRQAYLHQVTASEYRATVISFDAMVASVGGAGGQVGLGALSDARGFSAGYVVGGAATGLAIPVLVMLRRLGTSADDLGSLEDHAGLEATCPSGLPRETGVDAVPVAPGVD
jgi:Na+/melibiose symporter-like transporter